MRRRYRPRWPLLLTLIAGVAAVIGLTYLPEKETGEAVPERGGVYIEGVAGAPAAVNPLYASFNDVDQDIAGLVFAGLVKLGPNGGVEEDLAQSFQVTPDGLSYIFELRPGLFWHDGEPLDSADVVFTVRTIQHEDFDGDPALASLFDGVVVDAPDRRTVIMTLQQPFAPFLARAATVGILPEHPLANVEPGALDDAPFNRRPIGSGPFRLRELTEGRAVLVPFGQYYQGEPFLDRIELHFYRDDEELLNALLNERIDGALLRPGLEAEETAHIDGDRRWVRRPLHETTYSLVYLNPRVEAFAEQDVRRALQYGLDRERLIAEVLQGQGIAVDSPIVRDLWAYEGSPEAYAYNPAEAARLLDEAGWVLEDGVRTNDGVELAFSLSASDDPVQDAVAREVARQWGELGVRVELAVSGASQFVDSVLLPRRFDAALVTVDAGPDPDPYPLWHSTQILNDGRNLAGFSLEAVDRMLENGRLTTSNAERAQAYAAFQDVYAREVPAVLLYTPTYQYVVRSDVQGLSPGLLHSLSARFSDIHVWFVDRGTAPDDEGP